MDPHTRTTFRLESWRAVSSGILETGATTFLLLIAVRGFDAGPLAKALVAGGGSLGFLLSPWVVSLVQSSGRPTGAAAARLAALGAAIYAVMAVTHSLPIFVLGSVLATTSASSAIPLVTQIYQENYPARERGRLFSRTLIIRIGVAALFGQLAGQALSGKDGLGPYPALLLVFSLASLFTAWLFARNPSRPLKVAGGTHPFRALGFLKKDPRFRLILVAWMFMGVGNLMTYPLRVDYLANPDHGLNLDVATIALLTAVLPNVMRLMFSRAWGWLFDHTNFFHLRAILNLLFAVAILTFFQSRGLGGLAVGSLVFGMAHAGGDLSWALWVTKFAPDHRVADYMSVHTFFTGVRGLLAPMAGFYLAGHVSMRQVAVLSVAMILISVVMMLRGGRLESTEVGRDPAQEGN